MPRSRQGSCSSRQQRRENIRGTTGHEGNDTKEKPASNSVLYTLLSLPRDNDASNKALMRLAPQPLSTLIFLRNVLKYRRVQAQHVASPPGGGQRGDAPGASTQARGHRHPQSGRRRPPDTCLMKEAEDTARSGDLGPMKYVGDATHARSPWDQFRVWNPGD